MIGKPFELASSGLEDFKDPLRIPSAPLLWQNPRRRYRSIFLFDGTNLPTGRIFGRIPQKGPTKIDSGRKKKPLLNFARILLEMTEKGLHFETVL
jgi:hypothetical protein